MNSTLRSMFAAVLALGLAAAGAAALAEEAAPSDATDAAAEPEVSHLNDYPTVTRGDYIFGCMQVNGNTRLVLERCACSIDVIASIIPYEKYVEAETIMSLVQRGGESVAQMRHPIMQAKVHDLKLAQIEGELRCF